MTITKRVRMSEEEAARLADIATREGKTESDILREGILAYDWNAKREKAWQELIAMAERDRDAKWEKASGGWK